MSVSVALNPLERAGTDFTLFTLQCAQLSKAQSTKLHIMVHILEIPQSLMSQRNPESFFFFTLNGSIYSENVREDTLLIEKKKGTTQKPEYFECICKLYYFYRTARQALKRRDYCKSR